MKTLTVSDNKLLLKTEMETYFESFHEDDQISENSYLPTVNVSKMFYICYNKPFTNYNLGNFITYCITNMRKTIVHLLLKKAEY